MGAWGIRSFDNDDAADWVYELEESSGAEAIRAALQAISPDAYLEAAECSSALAAAEVVAALKGHPLANLPPEVVTWVADSNVEVDDDLLSLALMAIHRIETESALRELWQETDEFDSWLATLTDLQLRLGSP